MLVADSGPLSVFKINKLAVIDSNCECDISARLNTTSTVVIYL